MSDAQKTAIVLIFVAAISICAFWFTRFDADVENQRVLNQVHGVK